MSKNALPADPTLDEIRVALAPIIGRHAGFDGWSEAAVYAAADEVGVDRDVALLAFKGKAIDMIDAWVESVDLELDAAHYETAYQRTIGVYRQRAQNAYEESYIFMELVSNVNIYTLPQEVITVRQIFRRTFGDSTGPFASNFDPFSQASMNVYLMNFNVAGGLATYDFYSQYVELAGRMFGAYMNYTYNPVTKKLQLIRDPKGTGEAVLMWCYNFKTRI
jgi:hypothetical protein